jgi:hypothetical protein
MVRLALKVNSKLVFLSPKTLSKYTFPFVVVHCSNLLVPLHLNSTPKTIIKFDLWMSRRQHDIFGLVINFLTINWKSFHVTIGLLIDNDITKHGLARELETMSKSFHLNDISLCYFKKYILIWETLPWLWN